MKMEIVSIHSRFHSEMYCDQFVKEKGAFITLFMTTKEQSTYLPRADYKGNAHISFTLVFGWLGFPSIIGKDS